MANQTISLSSSDLSELTQLLLGIIIQSLLNGGIIILGLACIFLLASNRRKCPRKPKSRQSTFWISYIIGLISLNITSLVIWWLLISAFLHRQTPEFAKGAAVLSIACTTTLVSTLAFTDGVLVWRCYKVQSALGPPHGQFKKIFWIIPLLIYTATIIVAAAGIAISFTDPNYCYPAVFAVLSLGLNSLLNIYATSLIAFRLLQHQRLVKSCLGPDNATQHQRIIRVLLESAAINVPITLTIAIGRAGNQVFSFILLGIGVGCQSFSTILILHQVALGKAVGNRDSRDEM